MQRTDAVIGTPSQTDWASQSSVTSPLLKYLASVCWWAERGRKSSWPSRVRSSWLNPLKWSNYRETPRSWEEYYPLVKLHASAAGFFFFFFFFFHMNVCLCVCDPREVQYVHLQPHDKSNRCKHEVVLNASFNTFVG